MQPVQTVYRAEGIAVQYHFLAVVEDDAMENGTFTSVVDLIDSDGDEFNRGGGAMADVGFAVSFRADHGPIDVELHFGPLPAVTTDKTWTGVVSFAQPNIDVIAFSDSVFGGQEIPLPAGPGIYRAHVQWRYRERSLPADPEAPYDMWSEEDQQNPASEDFWETVVITLESAPDAAITASPYQDPVLQDYAQDPAYTGTELQPTWTDQYGATRAWTAAVGSEEWLEQEAATWAGTPEPSILSVIDDNSLREIQVLITGVPFEPPMLLPDDPEILSIPVDQDHLGDRLVVGVPV